MWCPHVAVRRALSWRIAVRQKSASAALPAAVVKDDTALLKLVRDGIPSSSSSWRAFYASSLGQRGAGGAIVTDPAHFHVPLDDHGFHRGHAVFDTCNVDGGLAYGIGFHLDRLLRSAAQARIEHSFEREWLREVILRTIAAGGQRDNVIVRYWMTAGRGGFGISPRMSVAGHPDPNFYVVVHDYKTHKGGLGQTGLREVFVKEEDVPFKPAVLASTKSNNYMVNSLMTMWAEDNGGTMGIGLSKSGFVTESSIGNVAVVVPAAVAGRPGVLRTPSFDGSILAGTTLRRAMDMAPALVDAGLLAGAEWAPVSADDVTGAAEVLLLGGGSVSPVVEVQGKSIGDGTPGPVFRALSEALRSDMRHKAHVDEVPWSLFE